MTKPISRKMAVDCLLYRIEERRKDMMYGMPCGICDEFCLPGQDIQFDHIHADVFGGPHEYKNLRPVHAECHKKKSKADVQANAKVKRLLNPKPSKRPMQNSGRKIPPRPFPKRVKSKQS